MKTSRRAPATALFTAATTLFLAALGAPAVAQELPASWKPIVDRFTAQLEADIKADTIGGITAGIVYGDRLVWARGFGYADRDRKILAKPETIYRIGSISKSFTAVALMLAAQQGYLQLDDPVQKYLPEAARFADAPPGAAPPTVRHLASHTAGLIREPALADAATGAIGNWETKVLESIPKTRFDTVPGARYVYSNIGFGVLGLTISRATHTPFMTMIENGIFKPLGMTSSTFVIDERLRPNLSVGYQNSRNGIDAESPAREHAGRGYKVPNGGIYSTVGDLARFIAAIDGALGDVLLPATARGELMRVQTPGNPDAGYGLGFTISRSPGGRKLVGHGGSVAGYTAHMMFDPEAKVGVILLRNYASGATNLARASILLVNELVAASTQR